MINIITVYKSGDLYTEECLKKLQNSVSRNLSIPHKHITLSDVNLTHCETIPFDPRGQDPQAYWLKVQMYRDLPQLAGPCLYFDLDMIVTGPLDTMVDNLLNSTENKEIWGAKNPFVHKDAYTPKHFFNSSILFWKNNPTHLWNRYLTSTPKAWKMSTKDEHTHGDQAFVATFADIGFVDNHCPKNFIMGIDNFIEGETSILFLQVRKNLILCSIILLYKNIGNYNDTLCNNYE